ncbi:hypothetical protein Mapa_013381 [Marchantia paleacea]|nr:hypothetical protein Mapa_013381 [Marchantia paleacea]
MVLIDIGEDAIQALSSTVDTASESQVEALGIAALAVILGLEREDTALVCPAFEEMDVDVIKRTYSALVCLFLEAAKNDRSQSEVVLFLRSECGFAEARGDLIAHLFTGKKDDLRGLLSQTANHSYLPHLEGVEWRLEYCVPAPDNPAVRELLYRVCLKTINREDGREDKLEFVASVEELQDLVSRLKDACKSVERAVQR